MLSKPTLRSTGNSNRARHRKIIGIELDVATITELNSAALERIKKLRRRETRAGCCEGIARKGKVRQPYC